MTGRPAARTGSATTANALNITNAQTVRRIRHIRRWRQPTPQGDK
jgi:hypothetical protein